MRQHPYVSESLAHMGVGIRMVERVISVAGGQRTVLVPEGIDPGFAYRPGTPPSEVIRQALAERAVG